MFLPAYFRGIVSVVPLCESVDQHIPEADFEVIAEVSRFFHGTASPMITGLLALTTAALFAGAAFYLNVAEHPARLGLDDRNLLAQWKPSYKRGYAMQASLAFASALLAFSTTWLTHDWRWALGGTLMLANWPYTLLIMMPTNRAIEAVPPEAAGGASRALLIKWGSLHAVRTALGLVAAAVFLWAAI